MNECRYIELFAGVGGFHVGLDRSDKDFYKCVMANQWEPGTKDQFAANIYRKRFYRSSLLYGSMAFRKKLYRQNKKWIRSIKFTFLIVQ